ncbi:hypothetical protein Tco_1475615 [Tanacetum coccineum]
MEKKSDVVPATMTLINSGSTVKATILDVVKKERLVYLYLKPELVLIFEEKLADKETGIQILRNQVQQKSKSSTVEEIVETHVADKKDTIEDAIVTMEDENEDY